MKIFISGNAQLNSRLHPYPDDLCMGYFHCLMPLDAQVIVQQAMVRIGFDRGHSSVAIRVGTLQPKVGWNAD